MSTPDQIQEDIARTRGQLSENVDRLTEKVSPSKVVGRRVDSVKSGVTSVRDRVMGSRDEGSGLAGAHEAVTSKVGGLSDAASSAPQTVRRQAQGNPLAAGLIAFGAGWLLSSLAPATQPEQQLAAKAESKAKDLAEPIKQQAQGMAENLKQPMQEAADQVKSTATDAAQQTADHAQSATDDVKAPLQQ